MKKGEEKTIRKISIIPLAKIQGIITGAMYLVLAIVMNIVGYASPESVAGAGIPMGIFGIIGAAVGGLIVGFLSGALIAWVYNMISPKIGGIRVELE